MTTFFTTRVWILIVALVLSALAISPSPWAAGVEVTGVKEGTPSSNAGVSPHEIILSINNQDIASLGDYKTAMDRLTFVPVALDVKTDSGVYMYESVGELGFVYSNVTVQSVGDAARDAGMQNREKIRAINGREVASDDDIIALENELFQRVSFELKTDKQVYAYVISKPPEIRVDEARKSNINKGLELQGGTRVLLKPVGEEPVNDRQVLDVIDVLNNRLNTYGLADVKIRAASDFDGNKFVLVEIAGASREEVKELMAQQGKFEARIGEDRVFTGGAGDVRYVCRNDATCAGIIPPCNPVGTNQYSCRFQFAITLSESTAKKHAEITGGLSVNLSAGARGYLSKTIDFYLDDQQVDSLQISEDLKGVETTSISISGPGFGPSEESAYEDAIAQMNKLQTILITGSLPVKLEIVKLDTISPVLGQEFVKNAFVVALLAMLGVGAVIFAVYRRIKIVVPMIITMLSEMTIILGMAALIQWNLDLAAIAGIIAAIGTGVDDQIIVIDEAVKGGKYLNWKEKVKRAFFIIFTAYMTTVVAMIPLWTAGAGLIRGFAVTTIIGVTIGVFITRPAFASMVEKVLE